ncbi:hypothetical protein ACFQU2_20255 [Siccirubricoccus deserti]
MGHLRTIATLAVLALAAGLPGVARAQPQNCADVIARDRQLSRATQALSRTGILDNLRGVGPFTIFAATDQGIARQPENLGALLFPQEGSARGGPRWIRCWRRAWSMRISSMAATRRHRCALARFSAAAAAARSRW